MTGPAVIRMPVLQGIAQYDLGPVFPDSPDQQPLMCLVIPEKSIGHLQVLPHIQLQDNRRPRRLFRPQFRRPSRPKFSPGEIHNTRPLAIRFLHQQSARTAQFYIIRMHGNSQYIQFHR
jgi:hypothetical protein